MQRFRNNLGKKFTVTVEFTPPRGPDLSFLFSQVESLKDKVDAINVTDCPLGKLRMGSIPAAYLIKAHCQVDTIFNFTCRDRTVLGLVADLLGAQALALENLLALTGDSPDSASSGGSKGVFEVDSLGLIKVINRLNQGEEVLDSPLDGRTSLFVGAAVNPGNADVAQELKRLEAKIKEGASFVFTQPIYEGKKARAFLKEAKKLGAPLLLGLMPLKSLGLAEYLNKNVPGINVPDRIMARLAAAPKEAQRETGAAVTLEIFQAAAPECAGVHLMPAGDLDLTCQILESIRHSGPYS